MTGVAAVVVTHNRLADLKVCLERLAAQTRPPDSVWVVDNGSTDGTAAWLAAAAAADPRLRVVTQGNEGGAGGFATGIEGAFAEGKEWIWCMDDDCVPASDALERLLASPSLGPCIKNSLSLSLRNPDELAFFVDRPNARYRRREDVAGLDLVFGVAALFNGTLIHREVVAAIGVPDRRLFIWGDEVEFMTRAQRHGFPVATVPSSVFHHPPAVDRDGIPWPGAWKQYYAVRNQRRVFQNLHGRLIGTAIYARWAFRETLRQWRSRHPDRRYNGRLFLEAATDSLLGRFHKRPDTIRTLRLYRRDHRAPPPSPSPASCSTT